MISLYKQEIKDGLGDLVKNNTLAYINQAVQFTPSTELEEKINSYIAKAGSQPDLFYMTSILASVGWNANDDVFDAIETFTARNTPVDKPFNYMHKENDIIGHMTASTVLDQNGKVIASEEKELPNKFDIAVCSVLYKSWSDNELQTRMDDIIQGIKDGKWFVSMECIFPSFDYAIVLPDGSHKVVARNEESSFLTKHLRVYGGKGEYEGAKIGRLLRNFTFSGKGLVDNPANKRSVIFNNYTDFSGSQASIKIFTKGNKMDEVLKTQLDETKRKLDEVLAENKTLQAKAQKEAEEAVAAKVTAAETATAEALKVTVAKDAVIKTKDESIAKLEADVKAHADKLEVATKELEKIKADSVITARLAKLASAGVEGEEATKLMAKFSTASEEMFDEIVSLTKAAFDKKFFDKKKEDDKKKDKAKSEESPETDESGEKKVDATDVEKTEAEKKADLQDTEEDASASLRTMASDWFGKNVFSSTKKLNVKEKK